MIRGCGNEETRWAIELQKPRKAYTFSISCMGTHVNMSCELYISCTLFYFQEYTGNTTMYMVRFQQ